LKGRAIPLIRSTNQIAVNTAVAAAGAMRFGEELEKERVQGMCDGKISAWISFTKTFLFWFATN
jgi:hypothetical protein